MIGAVLVFLILSIAISITALAGTTNGTTNKSTAKKVTINNPPEKVEIAYDYGTWFPGDDASMTGSASSTSNSARYVRTYAYLDGCTETLTKTAADANGKVSVSGRIIYHDVDQATGNGYSEVRSGLYSTSTLLEKVSLTVTINSVRG
jgi:hypothetical protein